MSSYFCLFSCLTGINDDDYDNDELMCVNNVTNRCGRRIQTTDASVAANSIQSDETIHWLQHNRKAACFSTAFTSLAPVSRGWRSRHNF